MLQQEGACTFAATNRIQPYYWSDKHHHSAHNAAAMTTMNANHHMEQWRVSDVSSAAGVYAAATANTVTFAHWDRPSTVNVLASEAVMREESRFVMVITKAAASSGSNTIVVISAITLPA